MININLRSEYILSFWGVQITNTFLTSVIVSGLLIALGTIFYLKKENCKNIFISGIMVLIFEIFKFVDSVAKERKLSKQITPLISTFFLFIVTANTLALVPGFLGSFFIKTPDGNLPILRSPNSDLTTTVALALFSVFAIQFFSVRTLGIKKYVGRFLNFANPIKFVLGFFGLLSEAVKILSFSFRLFGNIFAGEALLLATAFLIPYIIPLPFMILEVFVGVVQAFIFAVLTLTFIKTSTIPA